MTLQWLQLILSAVGAIVLPLILFAFKMIWTIRTNDLHEIHERLTRIEQKIDDHIVFHGRDS